MPRTNGLPIALKRSANTCNVTVLPVSVRHVGQEIELIDSLFMTMRSGSVMVIYAI